jgi:N6-adenosine-specific RNA methylase IME4
MPIAQIVVGAGRRETRGVDHLAESIRTIGLLNPITVSEAGVLIAGLHRLKACMILGWEDIPVHVVPLSDLQAKLAELDENLIRNEGTALERADWLLERKQAYEALHPDAEAGIRRAAGMNAALGNNVAEIISPTFTADTARKTGVTGRSVRQSVQIARDILPEVKEALRDTEVAEKQTELLRLAKMEPEQQAEVARVISSGQARNITQAQKRIAADEIQAEPPPLPKGPFRVIVADPPWMYDKRPDDDTHRSRLDYPSMTIPALCELPVRDIAADDCVLWLWTTNAHMRHAYSILDSWGFEERTILTWAKNRMGCGDWLRGQTEHCILAVKGRPTVTLYNQTTLLNAPVRQHSRKPDEFFDLVDRLCPGSKVELFCREARPGWAVFGNEVDKFHE